MKTVTLTPSNWNNAIKMMAKYDREYPEGPAVSFDELINSILSLYFIDKKSSAHIERKQLLVKYLTYYGGNLTKVAKEFSVHRRTVFRWMQYYNLKREDYYDLSEAQ